MPFSFYINAIVGEGFQPSLREKAASTDAFSRNFLPFCPDFPDGMMKKGVIVRHLILPGLTSESIALLNWVKDTLPAGTPVSLMRQYVPCNDVSIKGLDRTITTREYHRVRDHMQALELPGFQQEATSASTDFVPLFGQEESYI